MATTNRKPRGVSSGRRARTLRDAMTARGLGTAGALADASGVSLRTVYRALSGRVPYRGNLTALALALRMSPAECEASIRRGAA